MLVGIPTDTRMWCCSQRTTPPSSRCHTAHAPHLVRYLAGHVTSSSIAGSSSTWADSKSQCPLLSPFPSSCPSSVLTQLPSLLLPAPVLMAVGGDDLAALGFLGRRAVRFAETELRPDKVVTEAALRKLRVRAGGGCGKGRGW